MTRRSACGVRILVLDGEERASVAVSRSLVRADFDVIVASRRRWSMGGAVRGTRRAALHNDPRTHPLEYATEVAALARRIDARLLVPLTDSSTEPVLQHRALLPQDLVLPLADLRVFRAAADKALVHDLACEIGLGIPETEVVQRAGDPAPANSALYPGVVKPHRSLVGAEVRRHQKVRQVADRPACEAVLRDLPPEAFPVLVQRRVRGPGEGYFAARWRGVTLARFAHRRLREKPPSGGVSVYRESIHLDPELQERCDRLLDRLDWEGVAMVECKRDLDHGGWRVMEINGRFWGSLQLAVDAGVDFPRILAEAALGAPPAPPPAWREGVRLRWEWGDLDHLTTRMTRSREQLALPADAPGRLGTIAAFLSFRPGRDRLEVFRASDPVPFIVETLNRFRIGR